MPRSLPREPRPPWCAPTEAARPLRGQRFCTYLVSAGGRGFPAEGSGSGRRLGVSGHECPDRPGPVLVEGGDVAAALDGPQRHGNAGRAVAVGLLGGLLAGDAAVEVELAAGGGQRAGAAVLLGPVADGFDGAGVVAL